MSEIKNEVMPSPPEPNIELERIAGADERWQLCPLRDCKRDSELLYEDFFLRDVRTNRLMCSACTVRTEIGYMAREVVKANDDRFFTGTLSNDARIFLATAALSTVVNVFVHMIGFWYFAIMIGGGAGYYIGTTARRVSGKRITRQSPYVAIGGLVLGAFLSVIPFMLLNGIPLQLLLVAPQVAFDFGVIICTAVMSGTVWGIFMRRI